MLLSMVATADQKTTATGSIYEQRFNVAASRARDRMYLFRSVELSKLSKSDLKARLIEHFRAPFHEEKPAVSSLRDLCQSEFERELYDALTESGYRVTPHVKVGGYTIDLVVEGDMDRRLAIECDGDQWTGQESWVHDMARQRILERAGWTFWRCFAATFVRQPKLVLQELLGTLTRMGIEPVKTGDLDLGRYTEYREATPFRVSATSEAVVVNEVANEEPEDENLAS
jgi:very-short-patch-repair endonuclease